MIDFLAATQKLLDQIERDEADGGLLSRDTHRSAGMVRQEMRRVLRSLEGEVLPLKRTAERKD